MTSPAPMFWPLLPEDPPKVGDFWLDSRLFADASGVAFAAHDDAKRSVVVILLSQGAANDATARDRFAGLVNQLHFDTVVARGGQGQDEGRLGRKFRAEDDDPVAPDDRALAPWVALSNDGSIAATDEARRLLRGVLLADTPLQGTPKGPGYELHWLPQTQPGYSRMWPLPWPGRYDRAGWLSIALSWLLMLILGAVAMLIAILILRSLVPPPPPMPSEMTSPPPSSQSSGTPPPSQSQSGSPPPSSSSSASPSQSSSPSTSPSSTPSPSQSASDSPSNSSSPQSASPDKSEGPGTPTPNSKL